MPPKNFPEWPKDDYPDRATAEAWANAPQPSRLFASVDQQRIKLAQQWLFPHKCPNCLQPMAVVDAIHVKGDDFVCGVCEAKLIFVVPLVQVGPVHWEWRIAPGQINRVSQDPEKGERT
jgi:hypothetical protein